MTQWTVAHPAPLSLQAGILEWVAAPSSRGSSRPRDQTRVSGIFCIAHIFSSPVSQGKPQTDYSLIQTLQLELRHQVAQERCQDIEIPFLSSQDPGAHFFFLNAKVIMTYNQSSLGILQLWLSPTIPNKVEIFFHFQVFIWNCRLSLIKKQKVGAWFKIYHYRDFPGGSEVKTLPSSARDVGSIPGQARIPRDSWPKN